jgi:hypothetical protein
MMLRFGVKAVLFLLLSGNIFGQSNVIDHWESVVYSGDNWHYYVGITSGPGAGWQNPGFNDATWLLGPGGFGYADNDDATSIPVPPNPTAVYTRIVFNIQDTSVIAAALLNMDYDDGFVAWINGVEVGRANLGTVGDFPEYNTPATDHEAVMKDYRNPSSFMIYKQTLKNCLKNGGNVLAVQVNNTNSTSSDMSCIAYLSVGLTTSTVSYRPVPSWFTTPYTGFSGSYLPLLVVETNGTDIPWENKLTVDLGIIDKGNGQTNTLLDERNVFDGKAGIEIRGSSSTMFPKKNYGLETRDPAGSDSAVALLGMPAESDWILHGPYSDKSLMRNFLAYNLANAMGHYAPRTRFCEMFINGQYQGVYVLMEKIKRDSNRVDIAKLKTDDVMGDDLTGGYIVKIDRTNAGYTDGWFSMYPGTGTTGDSPFFAYHYPDRTEIVQVQKDYIRNRITAFETALYGNQYRDPVVGYRKYIDVDSFIDYFILVELSKNTDGYRLSTFMHKDRDDKDPLIHMGPIWDYDLAFGNADYLEAFNTYGWNYTVPADGWGTPFWWSKLIADPYFANRLNCRWKSLRQGILSNESLTGYIDAYALEIGEAADRNFVQWPIHGTYVWPNVFVGNTYAEDINFMKTWILGRFVWMDSHIPGAECTAVVDENGESRLFSLRAYPNPAIGEINVEIQNELEEEVSLQVINITGQLVYARELGRAPLITENVSLHPGIYTVRVTKNMQTEIVKIIIQ